MALQTSKMKHNIIIRTEGWRSYVQHKYIRSGVTCRQMSTVSSHGNNRKRLSCAPTDLRNITKQQHSRAARPSPLPSVTVRTTENTPVAIVHAAQAPNMARRHSASALELLAVRRSVASCFIRTSCSIRSHLPRAVRNERSFSVLSVVQITAECALRTATIRGHSEAIVKRQAELPPPVAVSSTRQRQAVENASVVDVVRPAQVPNMAPSAVAQPPIILTKLNILIIRQRSNLVAVLRGIVRPEDLSDVDRQEIDRIADLIEAAWSSQA
ncbi:hypothetical protein PROFUN_10348 [Planoprotostelium fungivorum]|uniref:Uncharacterized protein n=1 Tax=Planoprotostelium fungivorum TaxID=1890364 RepID=A0A2P6NDW6_9EUKA|nr:hypothetical protein PROFUN_10348 [Planoprotostelium fungivorum]